MGYKKHTFLASWYKNHKISIVNSLVRCDFLYFGFEKFGPISELNFAKFAPELGVGEYDFLLQNLLLSFHSLD